MSCLTRFPALKSSARHLIHFHFPSRTNYAFGDTLQRHFLNIHLQHKLIHRSPKATFNELPSLMFTFQFDPVYTGGKREANSLKATKLPSLSIPFVQTDRGGQVTYHGPGQLVAYFVWDLANWSHLTSKCFVNMLEQSSLNTMKSYGINEVCTTNDTGVWVQDGEEVEKISSLGLNMKRNVSSHGISINVDPDLTYLNNPNLVICGLEGKRQTSLAKLGLNVSVGEISERLGECVADRMSQHMQEPMYLHSYSIPPTNEDDAILKMESLIKTHFTNNL